MQQTLTVEAQSEGQRLDKFLQQNVNSFSRTKVNTLIKEEKILVNGAVKKPSYRLKEKDSISIHTEEEKKRCIETVRI